MIGKRLLVLGILFLFVGCAAKAPHMVIPDYAKEATRLIAVMPILNKTNDQLAARMVREKILQELYFKGYPKIPLDVVDTKLLELHKAGVNILPGNISPQTLGDVLKVDALMSCTLNESELTTHLLYGSTSLSASCELRDVKRGRTLWQARYGAVSRHFGYSRFNLKIKLSEVYEESIREVVDKIVETLPDGPDLVG